MIYHRRKTHTVYVGHVGVGGQHPIRIQSMITAPLTDPTSAAAEIEQLALSGCEIVRFTVPTKEELKNIPLVRKILKEKNIRVPLVADIHFTPSIAYEVVPYVEKIRINPGNFIDKKLFQTKTYNPELYKKELAKVEEKFVPLIERCREYGVALRIGTNHGSLSDRIMSRFGDTPEGMVESALEFIQIAYNQNFHDIILSMKASNIIVMINAYRLLAKKLDAQGLNYPFHLGVTEAGNAEDGRIKSAAGIGTLLNEGIGDTIRVSLTEDSVHEIPVAYAIAAPYNKIQATSFFTEDNTGSDKNNFSAHYERHKTRESKIGKLAWGHKHPVRVWTHAASLKEYTEALALIKQDPCFEGIELGPKLFSTFAASQHHDTTIPLAIFSDDSKIISQASFAAKRVILIKDNKNSTQINVLINTLKNVTTHIEFCFDSAFIQTKNFLELLYKIQEQCCKASFDDYSFSIHTQEPAIDYPLLLQTLNDLQNDHPIHLRYTQNTFPMITDSSTQIGSLLVDGIGDSIQLDGPYAATFKCDLSYSLLQACRVRISKTEYITCPSCGRTQFDLQKICAKIKAKTNHLKGVKIGIMGCIVNGPGEMADADFGYVGMGQGKVSLYQGQDCVERNIPEDLALDKLINLIKENGLWTAPTDHGQRTTDHE
ncbi:MAG: (E)-4-hydroxy-3-methylbut-2-enyl-diphosphate synthase [bacterium]|nr:(E)-4-hydroxy-3-methylbut-2-enyl-diphosphate synthase [bacterium]